MLTVAAPLCGCASTPVAQTCQNPVEVRGERTKETPGILVFVRDGTDTAAVLEKYRHEGLSGTKGFANGFYANDISSKALASLRCDPAITELTFGVFVQDI
jgi:hypothetical protein